MHGDLPGKSTTPSVKSFLDRGLAEEDTRAVDRQLALSKAADLERLFRTSHQADRKSVV